LGGHQESDLDDTQLVVVNPAVDRRRSEFFARIIDRRIPWTTEINLFLERCCGRVIGVTGTAGKSTTCALLHEALQPLAGPSRRVWFGGNVGRSLLMDLETIRPGDLVILELSSFQLEAITHIERSGPVGLLTNAWPNHLDRHGTFEAYLDAKLNLFRFQRAGDLAVVADVNEAVHRTVEGITARTGARLVTVPADAGPYELRLPGSHQQANAACAATVAGLLGADEGAARARMAAFAGLPHRLQHVATVEGVAYYNDSKSTTPAGTATALAAFDQPVIVIVGGQERGDDLTPLVRAVNARAAAVMCLGQSGPQIAEAVMVARGGRDEPAIQTASDLVDAVQRARRCAAPGYAVVLSPGAPSYGDFVNYEHRGRAFIEAVQPQTGRQ
jgi:UDP-N-acetylmuramoylalanine--D-glutamate ligase